MNEKNQTGKTARPAGNANRAGSGKTVNGRSGFSGQNTGERKGPYGRTAGDRKGPYGKPSGNGKGPYGKPAQKKENAPMEGLEARRIALSVLRKVTEGGAYASLTLDEVLQGSGLNSADRRLVSRLVYDTLDHLLYLDHALSQVMAREDTDIKLKNILRLGACQILLEDRIPESAATNTCVELCRELGMEGLKGVCNGILRNLVRKKDELIWPDPETEPDKAFSLKCSVPEWLAKKLRADYGGEAEKVAGFRNGENYVTVRPNLTRMNDAGMEELLAKKIWGREKTEVPYAWRITGAMDIGRDSDFTGGNFSIQSESSVMAALAADVRRGKTVLDCCAAPGGKTCLMAEIMGGTGRVQAWDIHEHRVQLIAAQAKRLGLENIRPIVRDASVFREDLTESMDTVLLDAPCSGLGVMAEKPDIRLRVTEESVAELIALQAKLLDTVCRYVKPGGTLVYSTCSVLKDENERQTAAFLEKHPEFEAVPLPDSIPEKYRRYADPGLQLLPYRDGVEGFYICRMKRKAY